MSRRSSPHALATGPSRLSRIRTNSTLALLLTMVVTSGLFAQPIAGACLRPRLTSWGAGFDVPASAYVFTATTFGTTSGQATRFAADLLHEKGVDVGAQFGV